MTLEDGHGRQQQTAARSPTRSWDVALTVAKAIARLEAVADRHRTRVRIGSERWLGEPLSNEKGGDFRIVGGAFDDETELLRGRLTPLGGGLTRVEATVLVVKEPPESSLRDLVRGLLAKAFAGAVDDEPKPVRPRPDVGPLLLERLGEELTGASVSPSTGPYR